MKQNKPLQMLAAAVLLLAAGCTQNETNPGEDPTPKPLQVSTVKVVTAGATQTREAGQTTDYPHNQAIGFIVKEDAARGYVALNNWKGLYNDTTRNLWLPIKPASDTAAPDSIWLNNNEADIAIYAPYDTNQPTDGTLKLAACVRPNNNTKDIWCKTIKASNANPTQAPVLEHLYTRIRFTVTRSTTYTAKATITAIELAGKEVYPTAVYSPFATTPYDKDEAAKKFAPTVTTQTLQPSTPTATYDLLLIPATLTEDITLTLTVDGVPMKKIIDKAEFTGSKLEPGKKYNASLLLKPGVLELFGEVTIAKWDNSIPPVDGGQAEFDEPGVIILPPLDDEKMNDNGWPTAPGTGNGAIDEVKPVS